MTEPAFDVVISRTYDGYWVWSVTQSDRSWWKKGETSTRWGARREARYAAARRAKQLRTPIHRETYTPGVQP